MIYTGHRGWRGDVGKKQMRSRVSEVRDKKETQEVEGEWRKRGGGERMEEKTNEVEEGGRGGKRKRKKRRKTGKKRGKK